MNKTLLFLSFFFALIQIKAQNPLITTWNTNINGDNSNSIIIPTQGSYSYTWVSDDNSTSGTGNGTTGKTTIVFPSPGVYHVSIFPNTQFKINYNFINTIVSEKEKNKFIEINQWGNINWNPNLSRMFWELKNLKIKATDIPDFSNVTNMNALFLGCSSIDTIPNINSWNVGMVIDMSQMFQEAHLFNDLINDWNTSNVTNMSQMFYLAYTFNQPLNKWNTSNVTDMSYMFYSYGVISKFNQNVDSWNVEKVTNFKATFSGASSFNQPLNNWNTISATNMSWMFSSATSFNQPISNWNTSNVNNMSAMFTGAKLFNQPIGNWDTSKVTDISHMFSLAESFNQPIGNWNISMVNSLQQVFYFAKNFNQDINNWDTSNVNNMKQTFYEASNFNQPLNNWNTSNVETMEAMFYRANNFNRPIGNWDTSRVTEMQFMFADNINISLQHQFNQDLSNWDTSNVLNMTSMFHGAKDFNQPIGNWNTKKVKSMGWMFKDALSFNQDLGKWNLSSITHSDENNYSSLGNMFSNSGISCENYGLTLKGWYYNIDTPNEISLGANQVKYGNDGKIYRDLLESNKSWYINNDIYDPTCNTTLTNFDNTIDNSTIIIYPNPTTNTFFVKSEIKIRKISLLDQSLKLIFETTNFLTGIEVKNLASGNYFVKVETKDSKVVYKKIIIKE